MTAVQKQPEQEINFLKTGNKHDIGQAIGLLSFCKHLDIWQTSNLQDCNHHANPLSIASQQ